MALRRLTPGDRIRSIPVEFWNGVVDLLNASKRHAQSFETRRGDGDEWIVLTEKTDVIANAQYDYSCHLWVEDCKSTSRIGGFADTSVTYKARNTLEEDPAHKGYYTASNVTGVKPLPLNVPIKATRIECADGVIFRVAIANEPICS